MSREFVHQARIEELWSRYFPEVECTCGMQYHAEWCDMIVSWKKVNALLRELNGGEVPEQMRLPLE